MAGSDRPGTLIPAAALVALLLFDLLRVWLPSLLFTVDMAPPGRIAAAIGVVMVAPLLLLVLWRVSRRNAWLGSVGVLLASRAVLQAQLPGGWLLAVSSIAVVAASLAIGTLAILANSNGNVRYSVLTGFAASGVIHVSIGMTDLVWRTGAAAWGTTLLLLAATGYTAWTVYPSTRSDDERAGARWPWWLFGPILLLLGSLVMVPGRVAEAVRWTDPTVAAVTVVAAGLLVLTMLVGRWFGPAIAGPAGAALTLVGTAGALQPTSWTAVVSQLSLSAGLGLVVAALDRAQGYLPPRRVATAAAGFPAVFVILAILYYLPYGVTLPFPNRAVLLLASAAIAIGGIWAGASRDREVLRERDIVRRLANGIAITVVFALLAGLSVGGAERGPTTPGAAGEPIRVAHLNLHMGFGTDGRFDLHQVSAMLAAAEPDIVVLNEVDRGWMATGGHDTLRQLSANLGMSYVFGPAADEVWGNAVLSRYPVTEYTIERLPRGRDPMGRSQLIAVLEVAPEQNLAVIATQLSVADQQGDTRLPQARSIAATLVRLRDRDVPVLLAGSLNAELDSAELESLTTSTRSVLPDGHPTWPGPDPELQLDHILTTEDIRIRESGVIETDLLHHRPVVTVLEIVR